jgi:xylulokinase
MHAMQTTAGGNLTFLRDRILYPEDALGREEAPADFFECLGRMAEGVPAGSNGVIYTPWVFGERSPVDDRTVRAAIYNLSLEHSRAEIVRAFLEGVALNTRWLLRPFEKAIRQRLDVIHMIGGGAGSDLWCQIFADVMDRPIRQLKDPIQANVRGAAFIASVGMGFISFQEIPGCLEYRATYRPRPENRSVYDAHFREFVNIYKRNRRIFRRLNASRSSQS